jgi:hypothetical protein
MAQYRKTFFSMGGPERISDPGADELARMLGLRLQAQGQAQQLAQGQARMSLEERLALEQGAREDRRMAAEQSAAAQRQALAERGYGLQERQFGEQVRGNQASERSTADRDRIAAELGRAGVSIQREDLGVRRAGNEEARARWELDRTDAIRERQAARTERQDDLAKRIGADARRAFEDAQDRARLASERMTFDERLAREQRAHETERDTQRFTREDEVYARAMREQKAAEDEEALRKQAESVAQGLGGVDTSPLRFEAPDPGLNDPNLIYSLPFGDKGADVAKTAEAMRAALARSGSTTERELERNRQAIELQARADFEAATAREKQDMFDVDNARYRQQVLDAALRELLREYEVRKAALTGAPGPDVDPRRTVKPR